MIVVQQGNVIFHKMESDLFNLDDANDLIPLGDESQDPHDEKHDLVGNEAALTFLAGPNAPQ